MRQTKDVVQRNVLECLIQLLDGHKKFNLRFEFKESKPAAKFLSGLDIFDTQAWSSEAVMTEILTKAQLLWRQEPTIQQVYQRRNDIYLFDSCAYLLQNIDRILTPDFLPNTVDFLRCR